MTAAGTSMQQSRNQNPLSCLASLFEIYDANAIHWSEADLKEMFQHQLRTPLLEDLRPAPNMVQYLDSTVLAAGCQPLNTFGDLLRHSNPPIELLRLVKEFAKNSDGDDALPSPVASAMYALIIATAMVRLDVRITTMNDAELRQGLHWVIAQAWIEQPMRQMAVEAFDKLKRG
jgi:hypothetical protein